MSEETMDDVVKRYAKRWNVPEDEAATKILTFLESEGEEQRKLQDRASHIPRPGDFFPAPLGDLSRKIQDVNQALLTTEFTKRSIAEMRQPPQSLQEINILKDEVKELKTTINTTLKEVKDTLAAKNQEESRRVMLEQVENMIKPLQETVNGLQTALTKSPTLTQEGMIIKTPKDIIKAQQEYQQEAETFLKNQGYAIGRDTGMSVQDVIELRKLTLDHEKWKTEQEWKREEKLEELGIRKASEEKRWETLEKISQNTMDKVSPLIDVVVQESQSKVRNIMTPPGTSPTVPATVTPPTGPPIKICDKCGEPIPVIGDPDEITCPECGQTYKKQSLT